MIVHHASQKIEPEKQLNTQDNSHDKRGRKLCRSTHLDQPRIILNRPFCSTNYFRVSKRKTTELKHTRGTRKETGEMELCEIQCLSRSSMIIMTLVTEVTPLNFGLNLETSPRTTSTRTITRFGRWGHSAWSCHTVVDALNKTMIETEDTGFPLP
ncbi:hypothetical protein KC19_6G138200 [Ceratodon purpureus]|uniref:Uncharacterized protein n=1 Tax=Ceratodon purpureus TaxID=3225 RepID=A0A8T0HE68_CERPU|nr:hypothetical protein KC19_6G138200 [Ceratodon purpureus]